MPGAAETSPGRPLEAADGTPRRKFPAPPRLGSLGAGAAGAGGGADGAVFEQVLAWLQRLDERLQSLEASQRTHGASLLRLSAHLRVPGDMDAPPAGAAPGTAGGGAARRREAPSAYASELSAGSLGGDGPRRPALTVDTGAQPRKAEADVDPTSPGLNANRSSGDSRSPAAIQRSFHWSPHRHQLNAIGGDLSPLYSNSGGANSPADSAFVASTLPLHWPRSLKPRQTFGEAKGLDHTKVSRTRSSGSGNFSNGEVEVAMGRSWYTFDPNSVFRMIYDMLSVVFLMYDLTAIPYVLAWDVQYTGFLNSAAWFTVHFWTVDIGINLVTGYNQSGQLVMHGPSVAKHYLNTWFVPDISVVLCDWLSMALVLFMPGSGQANSLKMLRFAKLGRLMRIIGMLRMLRFIRVLEEFAEKHVSESYRLAFRIVSFFLAIMWGNHLLACAWYAVGLTGPTDTGQRWVETSLCLREDDRYCEEAGMVYQYSTSFHWAAAQITLGGSDINPTNTTERYFTIIATMIGFLFGSMIISSLSAAMVDFQMMTKDRNQKLADLRQYLQQHDVDQRVACLVQQQAIERLGEKEKLSEHDVTALQVLSAALLLELRFEICRPHLVRHPLLRHWTHIDTGLTQQFVSKVTCILYLRAKDDLFLAGVVSHSAYFLSSGWLRYTQEPQSSAVHEVVVKDAGPNCWLCEAALWSDWIHVGRAQAASPAQLLAIKAEGLAEIAVRNHVVRNITDEYAQQFYKRIKSAWPPHAPWPTDLQVPFADYGSLVLSMPKEIQLIISTNAVDHLATQNRKRGEQQKGLGKLREEVTQGKSVVVVNGDGDAFRVVSIVALRIQQLVPNDQEEEECFKSKGTEQKEEVNVHGPGNGTRVELFVQLGKWEDGQMTAACQLPGGKQERDELAADAVRRLLETKLSPLMERVEIVETKCNIVEKDSKEHGVRTKYLRTIVSMLFHSGEALPLPTCDFLLSPPGGLVEHITTESRALDEAAGRFLHKPVFVVGNSDKANLYAWLSEPVFDFLTNSQGEAILRRWVASLTLPFPNEDHVRDDVGSSDPDIDLETARI